MSGVYPTPFVLLSGLLAVGCTSSPPAAAPSPRPGEHVHAPADTVRRGYTAADVHFLSAMIAHHAQAIEMARMAESHGASSAVRTLSGRIINAQQDEIAAIQQWLRDRGQPVPAVEAPGHHAHGPMGGMLTAEQMRRLDAARGQAFDRLFLTFMIQHHQGAVEMVNELLRHPGAAQDQTVFKLASDINVDQTTEIGRMQRMLADLLFESPSP